HAINQLSAVDQRALSLVFVQVLDAVLSDQKGDTSEPISKLLESLNQKMSESKHQATSFKDVYETIAALIQRPLASEAAASNVVRTILRIYEDAINSRNRSISQIFKGINTFLESVNKFLEGKGVDVDLKSSPNPLSPAFVVLPGDRHAPF